MREDFSSRLQKIVAGEKVRRKTDDQQQSECYQGWCRLLEEDLEPVLEETEQAFIFEQPEVKAEKHPMRCSLRVGDKKARCCELVYELHLDACQVNMAQRLVDKWGDGNLMALEDLTREKIEDQVADFLRKALPLI